MQSARLLFCTVVKTACQRIWTHVGCETPKACKTKDLQLLMLSRNMSFILEFCSNSLLVEVTIKWRIEKVTNTNCMVFQYYIVYASHDKNLFVIIRAKVNQFLLTSIKNYNQWLSIVSECTLDEWIWITNWQAVPKKFFPLLLNLWSLCLQHKNWSDIKVLNYECDIWYPCRYDRMSVYLVV